MKTYFDIINEHKEILISRIKSQVSDISYKNMNQIISLINDRFYIMIKEDLSDLINEVNE